MSREIAARFTRANVSDLNRDFIVDAIRESCDEQGVEFDGDSLTGHCSIGFLSSGFEWEIRGDDGDFVVEERLVIPAWWRLALFLSAVLFGYSALNWGLSGSSDLERALTSLQNMRVLLPALAGIGVFWVRAVIFPSPLAKSSSISDDTTQFLGQDSFFFLILPSLLGLVLAQVWWEPAGVLTGIFLLVLATLLLVRPGVFESASIWIYSPKFSAKIPAVVGMYTVVLGLLTTASLFTSYFIKDASSGVLVLSMSVGPLSVNESQVTGFVVGLTLLFFFVYVVFEGERQLREILVSSVKTDYHRIPFVVSLLFIPVFSGLSVLLAAFFVSHISLFLGLNEFTWGVTAEMASSEAGGIAGVTGFEINILQPYFTDKVSTLSSILALIASLPGFYLLLGVGFQAKSYFANMYDRLVNSRSAELDFASSAEIRVVDDDSLAPSSLSTGFKDYIFLNQKCLNELSDDELRAVIAHEQGHIENNDALLGMYLPLIGTVLLTAQNALFDVFNFREREFQADKYAVERIDDEEYLFSALRKLGGNDTRDLGGDHDGGSEGWREKFVEYKPLFFETFAFSDAHPTVRERIMRVNKRNEDSDS
jgi:Zn-dependent protease with chaperone function